MRALLLAIALLGSAAVVRSQDACLTGASTLGDQRALVTLRADTETVCPCEAATGRSLWRSCARTVMKSVLGAGGLRPECQKTALRTIKTATCGSDRSTCGRVSSRASVPVSCRVKRAATCTGRASFEQTPCADLAFCSDVVEWTAGTCSDVRQSGPFGVGVRIISMTKPAENPPNDPRTLDTMVWYPTTAGAGPIHSVYGGVLDAPVDGSGGPYPVVMFSHGSCGYPAQSVFLTTLLASRGFVVVAPPHPGNTIYDGLGVCGSGASLARSAIERPADVIFALDEMLAATALPSSDFHGVLDPTRIGMMGHSFGGFTTYRVVAQDARFAVAIPLAPAAGGAAPMTIPSLSMISTLDSLVNNAQVRAVYASSSPPKILVELQNTGHYAYSNGCFPSPDCAPPATLTQDEAHGAVLRWVIPFLEWRLRGDDTFAAFFTLPRPAGLLYESVP